MINELAQQVHENAKAKGFFDEPKNIGEMLCLIHSEVSEALEANRKNIYYSNANNPEWFLKGLAEKNFGATFYDDTTDGSAITDEVFDRDNHRYFKMKKRGITHWKKYIIPLPPCTITM